MSYPVLIVIATRRLFIISSGLYLSAGPCLLHFPKLLANISFGIPYLGEKKEFRKNMELFLRIVFVTKIHTTCTVNIFNCHIAISIISFLESILESSVDVFVLC